MMAEDIVAVDEWTSIVTVPEDGDDRDAPSVVPAYQALTNRSQYLLNRSGIELPGGTRHVWEDAHAFNDSVGLYGGCALGPGVNATFVDALGVPAPRPVSKMIGLYGGMGDGVPGLALGLPTGALQMPAGAQGLRTYALDLPQGAIVTGVSMKLSNAAGDDAGGSVSVYRMQTDAGPVEAITASTGVDAVPPGGSATPSEDGGTMVVDNTAYTYALHLWIFGSGTVGIRTVQNVVVSMLVPGLD
jgi:hypothetical protein